MSRRRNWRPSLDRKNAARTPERKTEVQPVDTVFDSDRHRHTRYCACARKGREAKQFPFQPAVRELDRRLLVGLDIVPRVWAGKLWIAPESADGRTKALIGAAPRSMPSS